MKNIIYILSILFVANALSAQCLRYQNEIFTAFSETTVTYSTAQGGVNNNLTMDIYLPTGDSYTNRPFVLMAHGGSFYSGTKDDDGAVTSTCASLCKRGYVCASINYRLTSQSSLLDSIAMIRQVMRAVSDAKSALRYMYINASTYGVDTSRFFIGGNSAGSILGIHEAYLNSTDNVPSYILNLINAEGGFEGNSGNSSISTPKVDAVINYAGGISRTDWINTGDVPMISFHGSADNVVPFNCGNVYSSLPFDLVDLCGSNRINMRMTNIGVNNPFTVYTGAGHCPWNSDATMMGQVISATALFLLDFVDCNATGVNSLSNIEKVTIYPNPAQHEVFVKLKGDVSNLICSVIATNGTQVLQQNVQNEMTSISLNGLNAGIYMLQLRNTITGETMNQRIIKQ